MRVWCFFPIVRCCCGIPAALVLSATPAAAQPVEAPAGTWALPPPLPPLAPTPAPTSVIVSVEAKAASQSKAPTPTPAPAAAPEDPLQRPAPSPDQVGPVPSTERAADRRFLHGFRLGYGFVAKHDEPVESLGGQSLKERTGMRTPHHFLIGYEAMTRMVGHSWLNVILVGNVMVAGLEQNKFFPTGNALLGFELDSSFQIGVGASLTPLKGSEAHTIVAAGWTPKVGSFYVPLHAFFIPDVDGVHRMGVTSGVTW